MHILKSTTGAPVIASKIDFTGARRRSVIYSDAVWGSLLCRCPARFGAIDAVWGGVDRPLHASAWVCGDKRQHDSLVYRFI